MSLHLLSPRLRAGIADTLRWSDVRPIQASCIPPVLAGENAVILAPTAGGKTEAAMLPALQVLFQEDGAGVRLLYVSPLVALLNDQEFRLQRLSALVGMRVFKWHGGVSPSERRRFRTEPSEVLLTTPESLEGMLLKGNDPAALFADLRFVVLDEIHALAGTDRGDHLSSVLERLARFSQHDVQRLGLSATVSNPAELGAWLRGSSLRRGRVIRPGGPAPARTAHLLEMPSMAAALRDLAGRSAGRKTLVFTESRAGAEQVAQALAPLLPDQPVAPYHAALDRETRTLTEQQLQRRDTMTVCATSALELGLDVGDLDEVVQWRPARSVSALLQRWGRTGRRADRGQVLSTYTFTPQETLTAAALLSLAQEGWVEEVRPSSRSFHILVQQMICEALHRRHTPASLWTTLRGAPPFTGILEEEARQVVDHLIHTDILALVRGELTIGDAGESAFGRRGFGDLLTAFDGAHEYTVRDLLSQAEVGRLDHDFVLQLEDQLLRNSPATFLLGGRAWWVAHIEHGRLQVSVRPSEEATPPMRPGTSGRLMGERLARRHLELLCGHQRPAGLNAAASASLEELAGAQPYLQTERMTVVSDARGLTIHLFGGHRIHATLAALLSPCGEAVGDAFTVHLTPLNEADRDSALAWLNGGWRSLAPEVVEGALHQLPSAPAGKFLRLLPASIAHGHLLETLSDWRGLTRLLERLPFHLHPL